MKGNEKMTRTGTIIEKTTGDETLNLTGTRKDTIDTDMTQKIGANAVVTVIGESKLTYTGHQIVDYKAELHVTEWQERWHMLKEVFHFEKVRVDIFGFYNQTAPICVTALL